MSISSALVLRVGAVPPAHFKIEEAGHVIDPLPKADCLSDNIRTPALVGLVNAIISLDGNAVACVKLTTFPSRQSIVVVVSVPVIA